MVDRAMTVLKQIFNCDFGAAVVVGVDGGAVGGGLLCDDYHRQFLVRLVGVEVIDVFLQYDDHAVNGQLSHPLDG